MTLTPEQQQFLKELDDNPAFADAVRDRLLTKELLAVPSMFAKFVEATTEFNTLVVARLDRLEINVAELKTGQARLETRMDRMEGIMGNLSGEKYERTAGRKLIHRAIIDLGMTGAYLAMSQDREPHSSYHRVLSNALTQSILTSEELDHIAEADVIISADGNRHAVVEVSLGPDASDITRAHERAAVWTKATQGETTPAVATPDPSPEFLQAARSQGVTVFAVNQ